MRVRTILPGQAWKVTKWVGDGPAGDGKLCCSCNVLIHRSRQSPDVVTLVVVYGKQHAYFLATLAGNHDITPYECPKYATKTEAMRAAEEWAESFAKGAA
jgi:hypothetical protein